MNVSRVKLAIVVACFNQEQYIGSFFRAFEKSLVGVDVSDLEIILSDDGSGDGSRAELSRWTHYFRQYGFIVRESFSSENVGTCAALRRALSFVSAPWIKPIACDDEITPLGLAKFLEYSACAREKVGAVAFGVETFGLPTNRSHNYQNRALELLQTRALRGYMYYRNPVVTPGLVVRTEVYRQALARTNCKLLEDWPVLREILASDLNILSAPEIAVRYRLASTQVSASYKRDEANQFSSLLKADVATYSKEARTSFRVGLFAWFGLWVLERSAVSEGKKRGLWLAVNLINPQFILVKICLFWYSLNLKAVPLITSKKHVRES